MDLEALAAFLSRRGLLLRSAHVIGDEVTSFTCDPAPDQPGTDAPAAPANAPDDPDGLEAYLSRKKLEGETAP